MVPLTRLNGVSFALNPDLIERVDETPDTVITLIDGAKYLVRESLDEVIAAVMDYRARLIAAAGSLEPSKIVDASERSVVRRYPLTAVPGPNDSAASLPGEA